MQGAFPRPGISPGEGAPRSGERMRDPTPTDPSFPAFHAADPEAPRDRRPPPGLALDPPDAPPPEHPPEIPPERLDADALKVIARLRHMHHQAYLVGGCVRDTLLGATPKDFDLATDAHPGEVRAIFRNCRLIGRRFRLAHVYFRGGKVIEVATFRKNPTDDGRGVAEATATSSSRRDNVFGTAEEDARPARLHHERPVLRRRHRRGDRLRGRPRRPRGAPDRHHRRPRDPHARGPGPRAARGPVRRAARVHHRAGHLRGDAADLGELARCAPARVLEEIFKLLRCGRSARAFELLRAAGALQVVLPALGGALDALGRRSAPVLLRAPLRPRPAGPVRRRGLRGGPARRAAGAPRRGRPRRRSGSARPRATGEPRLGGAEAFLASLVQTSRLPRKVAERIRLALHAQSQLQDPARRRRRRGRGLAGQTYFEDALQLLRIRVDATGEGRELVERWMSEGSVHAPAPAPEERAAPARAGRRGGEAPDGRPRRRAEPGARRAEIREVVVTTDRDEGELTGADEVEAAPGAAARPEDGRGRGAAGERPPPAPSPRWAAPPPPRGEAAAGDEAGAPPGSRGGRAARPWGRIPRNAAALTDLAAPGTTRRPCRARKPSPKPRYRRILLKLSGEALIGDGKYGISPKTLSSIAQEVKDVRRPGRPGRPHHRRREHLPRRLRARPRAWTAPRADYMGMLATVINALALQDALEKIGRAHPRADGHRDAPGGRAVHPAARHPPPREGPGRDLRGRHRQPVLHHRHRRLAPRHGDRRGGAPQGDQGGRRLHRRPEEGPGRRPSSSSSATSTC